MTATTEQDTISATDDTNSPFDFVSFANDDGLTDDEFMAGILAAMFGAPPAPDPVELAMLNAHAIAAFTITFALSTPTRFDDFIGFVNNEIGATELGGNPDLVKQDLTASLALMLIG